MVLPSRCSVSTMKKICILLMGLTSALGAAAQDVRQVHASISGRVLDVSGSPYPAQVRVFLLAIHEGFASLDARCGTNTHQDGGFECPTLPEGRFLIQVLPQHRSGKQTQKAQDAAAGALPESIFYPGVTDLEQATPISLRSNEAGWAEVRIADSPSFEVTGTLTGHPPNAFLRLQAESGDGLTLDTNSNVQYDSVTGRFVISNVPAGHYQLTANWFGGQQERHVESPLGRNASPLSAPPIAAAPNIDVNARLSLLPPDWLANQEGRRATLRFVVAAAPVDHLILSAAPNVEISGQLPTLPSGVTLSQLLLSSTDGSTLDRNASVKGGVFNFHSVPAGEYILSLPPGKQAYVDSVSVGGRSVDGAKFSVAPGQGTVNLELEIKGPSIPMRGSVEEWEGSAVSAEVIAQSEDSGEIYKVITDKQRNFSFAGVKPGGYRLFAWPGVDTIAYRSPLVLRKYNNDSTEVRVDEDGISSAIELSPIEKEH